MLEIRFHGRGGQGTVVATILMSKAFFRAGYQVQSFPFFGVERRGAPVEAYLRLDKGKILLRTNVYTPDHVVVLDRTLIGSIDVTRGMKDGGTITFNGHLDMADTTGQQILIAANAKNSSLNSLRFYMDSTSYWVPNQTTDYLGPGALSTGMGTPGLCSVNIVAMTVGMDKSGLGTVSFTAKVNGVMAMV